MYILLTYIHARIHKDFFALEKFSFIRYLHTCIHTYIHTCTHARMNTFIYTYTYAHTYTHTHTDYISEHGQNLNTYIHTHTYAQTQIISLHREKTQLEHRLRAEVMFRKVRMLMCICHYMYVSIHVCAFNINLHNRTRDLLETHTRTHTHTYIHTYITYIHTHKQ